MTTQITTPINISEAGDKSVGTGPFDLVALDSNSKLPAVDGSQLTNISGYFVAAPGVTTSGQLTSTQTLSVNVDCGFVPAYFKAFVICDIAGATTWGNPASANIVRSMNVIEGKPNSTIVTAHITHAGNVYNPTTAPALEEYDSYQGTTALSKSYITGTCAAPGTSTLQPFAYTSNVRISSITLSGNILTFNFLFTKGGENSDIRYGVKFIKAEK